jgi:hypothetical protein
VRPSKPTSGSLLTEYFSIIFYLDSFFKGTGHAESAGKMRGFFKRYLHTVLHIKRKVNLDLINVTVSVFP